MNEIFGIIVDLLLLILILCLWEMNRSKERVCKRMFLALLSRADEVEDFLEQNFDEMEALIKKRGGDKNGHMETSR